MNKSVSVDTLSFEEALGELESIVRGLEKGDTKLDDSIQAYERGTALKKHCEKKLQDAQAKIEKITVANDGRIQTQPLDPQE